MLSIQLRAPGLQHIRTGLCRYTNAIINAPESIAWIVFAMVTANVAAYVMAYSNPVIQSDAWYFLDAFIRKAVNGTLTLGDFFVKRSAMDHAQPLRKLILLITLRQYHLDFRYEAIAGLVAAALSLLILRKLVFWKQEHGQLLRGPRVWIWAALCVTLISLNGKSVWTWPLVASGFTSYVLLFASILALWRWLERGQFFLFILCILAFDIAADDTAELANAALLITLALVAWRHRDLRRRCITAGVMLAGCLLAVRVGYAFAFSSPPDTYPTLSTKFTHLFLRLTDGGWWKWITIPLGSSIAHITQLRHLTDHDAYAWQISIGLLLLTAHVWFWWRAFTHHREMTAQRFSAIAIMLFFYALLAGIIYVRTPEYGNDYLNQPRYVLIYSMNLVALLLMCADCAWNRDTTQLASRTVMTVFAVLFIAWQVPLSHRSWQLGPWTRIYHEKLAWQIGELARHDGAISSKCLPELTICKYSKARRIELVRILQENKLNVFSPTVQRATGMRPYKPVH